MTEEEFAKDLAQANAEVAQVLGDKPDEAMLFGGGKVSPDSDDDNTMEPLRYDPDSEYVVQFTSSGRSVGYVVVPMGLDVEMLGELCGSITDAILDADLQVYRNNIRDGVKAYARAKEPEIRDMMAKERQAKRDEDWQDNKPYDAQKLSKPTPLMGPPAPKKRS